MIKILLHNLGTMTIGYQVCEKEKKLLVCVFLVNAHHSFTEEHDDIVEVTRACQYVHINV